MDFGSNSVLERVGFGLKCVQHRVRVSQCRPSRVIQNPAERPPPSGFCLWAVSVTLVSTLIPLVLLVALGYQGAEEECCILVQHFVVQMRTTKVCNEGVL